MESIVTTPDGERFIIEHLKAIRASQTAVALEFAKLKHRMKAIESHAATIAASLAAHNRRLGHLEQRIGRIDRWLETRTQGRPCRIVPINTI
jgi:septal ring factor EnvC (AmiA/AmiB activator)